MIAPRALSCWSVTDSTLPASAVTEVSFVTFLRFLPPMASRFHRIKRRRRRERAVGYAVQVNTKSDYQCCKKVDPTVVLQNRISPLKVDACNKADGARDPTAQLQSPHERP